jgi:hypothetical protein
LPGGVCDEGHSALDVSVFSVTGRRFPAVLPHINEDGISPVDSMQDFWNKYFNFDEKKVAGEQLFDLAWQKKLRRDLITKKGSSPDLNKCGQESRALEIVR